MIFSMPSYPFHYHEEASIIVVMCCVCIVISAPNGERSSSTSNGISNSDEQYSECVMSGFATLPRTPKKLSFPTETHEFCFPPKVDSKIPSKSQPDLVKLYRQRININNISPTNSNCNTLHRVNACRHKKERTRDLDRADYVDEECIVVVSDAGLLCLYC